MTSKTQFPLRSRSAMKPTLKISHAGLLLNNKTAKLNSHDALKQLAVFLLLFATIIVALSNVSPTATGLLQLSLKSDNFEVQLPTVRERQVRSLTKPRLYFVPEGGEINCGNRYNVVCKFWFFIRCIMLGNYKHIFVVSQSERAIDQIINEVDKKDIILFSWRTIEGSDHTTLPKTAEILLKKRQEANESSNLRSVRIGIFHIANEKNRKDFPWYSRVDFVLRNYWIPQPPPHVLYIPLAPQYSDSCLPNSVFQNGTLNQPNNNGFVFDKSTKTCNCGEMTSRRASKRKNLWMFSGSLRGSRAQLVKQLNSSTTLKNEGIIHIARAFGGDGVVGSRNPSENPKTSYLNIISESAFVFAPCGNVMETHRIYEAVSVGAIPVIQNCDPRNSRFFPFDKLIIGNGTNGMMAFVEKYLHNGKEADKLQREMMNWWQKYINELQRNVSMTAEKVIPQDQRLAI